MSDFELFDHYQVLGVPRDASAEEIDRAYQAAMLREHPDRSGHPQAMERASRVNEAGRVLLDPELRRQYDPDADIRLRRERAGLQHASADAAGSPPDRGAQPDPEPYAPFGQTTVQPQSTRDVFTASRSPRRWFVIGAVVAAVLIAGALVYLFVIESDQSDTSPGGGLIRSSPEASRTEDPQPQAAQITTEQQAQQGEGVAEVQQTDSSEQPDESTDQDQASEAVSDATGSGEDEEPATQSAQSTESGTNDDERRSESAQRESVETDDDQDSVTAIDCEADPDNSLCRTSEQGELQEEEQDAENEQATLSSSATQFAGDHGGPVNIEAGRSLPQLEASLSERQMEVRLGPWFYQRLFQFSDDVVRRDGRTGLIGYNYYNSNWPSSVCRDENGEPLSYGWDSQPYDATPAGRQGVTDWRTRSWHSVYSVFHGQVAYVDERTGDLGVFDGRNTVYYKHLNEIDWRFSEMMLSDDGTVNNGPEVFPGDYLGRMGMRGTAIAPHVTLEVRAGFPPHSLCPNEGEVTSPLPYLYRLMGGR